MSFLNYGLLYGLIAASIPIIIHLLNRRRHRVVDWGAMRFLKLSFVSRHRRLRIEEILLLILRTLLIAALVVAMARPFFAGRYLSPVQSRRDLVIVLDTSFSMSLKDSSGSLFDRAREYARGAIGTLTPGDSVGVILGSRSPRPLLADLSYDFDKVQKSLARTHESLSSFDVLKSLDRALALLRKGSNPEGEILIITDGQRYGWFPSDTSRWRYVADQLADFKRKPRIYVMVVERQGKVSNLGLGDIALRRTVVGTDRDVRVTVNVRNTGDVESGPRPLSFAVDGKSPRAQVVEPLAPDTSVPISFTHRFTAPGSHYIEAKLEPVEGKNTPDALPLDDRAFFGLEVLESLPVLIVDGSASSDPLQRESLFLEKALQPTAQSVVKPTVVSPASLADTDLAGYRAVALVDVPQLSATDVAKLEEFVRRGGGLLIVPGDQVKPEVYNAALFKGGEGLLPTEMLAPVGDVAVRDKPFSIQMTGLTHETMQLLVDPDKSDLNQTLIWKYFKLTPPGTGGGSSTVLRLTDGDPLIVGKDFGRGRVMLTACPLGGNWSNLFMRSSYVVLAHELVYYLASPLIPARNVAAGEPLVVDVDESAPARGVDFLTPMNATKTVPVERRDGRRVAVLPETSEAGLYRVTYQGRTGAINEYYVVNFEPEESDLTLLAPSAREAVAAQTGMEFYTDWSRVEGTLRAGHSTREIWRWLAVLTLILLITETVLTRLFSRRKAADVDGIRFGSG